MNLVNHCFWMMECAILKIEKGYYYSLLKWWIWVFNVDWEEVCLSANTIVENDYVLWHKRLGHFNYATLKRIADLQMASGLPKIQQNYICETCQLGKQTKSVFPDNTFRSSLKRYLVHTNVGGLMQVKLWMVQSTFYYLLMTMVGLVGFIFLNSRLICLLSLWNLRQ